jgi:predicted pyridoxine 5'-phosphate oxidase superfamily flavin-nucleotide-binding protein
MPARFQAETFTPAVLDAQRRYYGGSAQRAPTGEPDRLGLGETEFIAERDSFAMATVSPDGWPYVQHRGGPPGFLQVLDAQTLAFADFKGNRQLISTGNLSVGDRVALLLIDHAHRERLKILGRARVLDAREHPDLADQLAPTPALRKKVERLVLIDVVAFDWNCAAWITARYTAAEVEEMVSPLRRRLEELESAGLAKKNEAPWGGE